MFLEQPAIRWDNNKSSLTPANSLQNDDDDNNNNNDHQYCCYWSPEISELLRLDDRCDTTAVESSTTSSPRTSTTFAVSYKTLFLLAAAVSHHVRQHYSLQFLLQLDDDDDDLNRGEFHDPQQLHDNDNDPSPVRIAVAIPEGPLLPLAILIVHALNRIGLVGGRGDGGSTQHFHAEEEGTTSTGSTSTSVAAVLVPIEPSEAKERNLHILRDARPAMILAVPGKDMERLGELEGRLRQSSENAEEDAIPQESPCRVIDFVSVVKSAKRSVDSLDNAHVEDVWNRLEESNRQTSTSSLQDDIAFLFHQLFDDSIKTTTDSNAAYPSHKTRQPRMSHIVYTSGTTGRPKGCVSSIASLQHYLEAKNKAHAITSKDSATVLLASSLSFDPCLSDILATFHARATLAIAPRLALLSSLPSVLQRLQVTHILCTPTLCSLAAATTRTTTNAKEAFPRLQCVALGGEPIPKRLVQLWARSSSMEKEDYGNATSQCRVLATYGVTEACVYQTCGEVFRDDENQTSKGQYVGPPLDGTGIRICKEDIQDKLVDVDCPGEMGEVVVFGKQVDALTGYLNQPALQYKFVAEQRESIIRYHYRTGDRGVVDPNDGSLTIMERIVGEDGMIKINGVRVELGEIEAALADEVEEQTPPSSSVIMDCIALHYKGEDGQSSIHAYCILSDEVCQELGIFEDVSNGMSFVIHGNSLWTLLRSRCRSRLKGACIPSAFVAISRLPISPTGKRDRSRLPKLESCQVISNECQSSEPLGDYGVCGKIVAETIIEVLNLQPCQQKLLTKSVSFAMMGGDSLSATLVARTLYSHHLQVENSRFLGGDRGQLPEPFTVTHLIRSRCLADYVDLLDKEGVCSFGDRVLSEMQRKEPDVSVSREATDTAAEALYEALLEATTLGHTTMAVALLRSGGANPNFAAHGHRIGKTSGRLQQRATFRANPLHLACTKGDSRLVQALLWSSANFKSPNTNGIYPIHLAAGTFLGSNADDTEQETKDRLDCVRMLLHAGCPLLMRDANKQSILHAAARAGHSAIIEFCIDKYNSQFETDDGNCTAKMSPTHFINWYDRWYRTAVHWATLNGRVQALRALLERGCDPSPSQPNPNKYTSMAKETPLEICERLHGGTELGSTIEQLLTNAMKNYNNKK